MTKTLVVAVKPLSYATRHYEVGGFLNVSVKDAKLLKAIKRVRDPLPHEVPPRDELPAPPAKVVAKVAASAPVMQQPISQQTETAPFVSPTPAPVPEPAPEPEDDEADTASADDARAALRDEYFEVIGKRVFHGWSDEEIRQRIEAARSGQ